MGTVSTPNGKNALGPSVLRVFDSRKHCAGKKFYPIRLGGRKNQKMTWSFFDSLGGRKNLFPAHIRVLLLTTCKGREDIQLAVSGGFAEGSVAIGEGTID